MFGNTMPVPDYLCNPVQRELATEADHILIQYGMDIRNFAAMEDPDEWLLAVGVNADTMRELLAVVQRLNQAGFFSYQPVFN